MRVILERPPAADDLIELWDHIAEDNVTRADAFIANGVCVTTKLTFIVQLVLA
jgi:hypothetical protein